MWPLPTRGGGAVRSLVARMHGRVRYCRPCQCLCPFVICAIVRICAALRHPSRHEALVSGRTQPFRCAQQALRVQQIRAGAIKARQPYLGWRGPLQHVYLTQRVTVVHWEGRTRHIQQLQMPSEGLMLNSRAPNGCLAPQAVHCSPCCVPRSACPCSTPSFSRSDHPFPGLSPMPGEPERSIP